jgi:hypothetical protein
MTIHNTPRVINLVLGIWLFLSAFIWTHTPAQFNNAWIVGLASALAAAIAMRADELRCVNLLLAIWLLISAWGLRTITPATFWNDVIVGIAMLLAAGTPGPGNDLTPVRPTRIHH